MRARGRGAWWCRQIVPGSAGGRLFGSLLGALQDLPAEPGHRVVVGVHHALLHRDDAVVGDLDVLRAHLGAAFGDVAQTQTRARPRQLATVVDVDRVHL